MLRVLVSAVLAGIVVFFWGAVAHMALPLGTMGISAIPKDEEAILGQLRGAITEPGFYFFPGRDMSKTPTESELEEWTAKLRKGPSGIMVVRPQGSEPMTPGQLLIELASDIAAAFVAALILLHVRSGFAGRVLVVVLAAAFGVLSISVSYWNWYGFPIPFEIAEATDQVVGWLLGGLVLAALVRPINGTKIAQPPQPLA
jgi:hypothetical protein